MTMSDTPADRVVVPMPAHRWKTRLAVPLLLIGGAILLLAFAAWERLAPRTDVRVMPVVVRSVQGQAGATTVQAPGWIEPDPHPHYAAALTDGVVEEVLVLEGARVRAGDVLARMVDDDARLALERAEAELAQRQAEHASAVADLTAARESLDALIGPAHALSVAEADVAVARAERAALEADLAAGRAKLASLQDEYDRKSQLVESGAAIEGEVVRLRLAIDAQSAALAATQARRVMADADLARAEADHVAATRTMELLIDERRAVALAEAAEQRAEAVVRLAAVARDAAAPGRARVETWWRRR
jgi:hypothetical protein